MIRAKNIEKLINNFERVLPFAQHETALDMDVGSVSNRRRRHQCGTIHCHAGWYLLAKEWDLKSKYLKRGKSFAFGVLQMENDLECEDISTFMSENPSIWGNKRGSMMFLFNVAFGTDCLTLDDIVVHWLGVYANLLAMEDERGD